MVPASRPNLGLSFPWPCPPTPCWEPGRLRQGRKNPKEVALSTALQGAVLSCMSLCFSVSPGPIPWARLWLEAPGACLCLTPGPMHARLYFSLSLSPSPCPLSLPSSVFPWPCLPVPISPCLVGGGAPGPSISASPVALVSDSRFSASGGGWGSSVSSPGLSIPVSVLSGSWLTLPIHPSQVSGSQNLCLRLSPSFPTPHAASSVSPEPSAPAQSGFQDSGGRSCPFSWGGGGGGGRGRPLTWPRPCRPPPHQPGFIKRTGPYIARPRGPGSPRPPYMARRLRAALGPAPGGRGAALGSRPARAPAPSQPPPPAARIPRPRIQSQLPTSSLYAGKSHPGPQCSPLSNGALGLLATLRGAFQ